MNDLSPASFETLPSLVHRAAEALAGAESSAEVLEARDLASTAYDAAKSAGRIARAKAAHDDILARVYRAQGDALIIEGRAKQRLADEYDAAQERGEVAGHGRSNVEPDNVTTAADLGLRRDQIHEARRIRDAERTEPGVVAKTVNEAIERGDEPTRAALRRSVYAAVDAEQSGGSRKPKNPLHKPDPASDRIVRLSSLCAEIADADMQEAAAWNARPHTAATLRDRAHAARDALTLFLDLSGG